MAKLQWDQLSEMQPLPRVQIHSIDWSIYQVSVQTAEGLRLIYSGDDPARFISLGQIKEAFESFQVSRFQLVRHNSHYDEMIGQPAVLFSDLMEVDLFWEQIDRLAE